jgi:hypothetical protein
MVFIPFTGAGGAGVPGGPGGFGIGASSVPALVCGAASARSHCRPSCWLACRVLDEPRDALEQPEARCVRGSAVRPSSGRRAATSASAGSAPARQASPLSDPMHARITGIHGQKAGAPSPAQHDAHTTGERAARTVSATRRDLPTPASPATSATPPRASRTIEMRASSSVARPTKPPTPAAITSLLRVGHRLDASPRPGAPSGALCLDDGDVEVGRAELLHHRAEQRQVLLLPGCVGDAAQVEKALG